MDLQLGDRFTSVKVAVPVVSEPFIEASITEADALLVEVVVPSVAAEVPSEEDAVVSMKKMAFRISRKLWIRGRPSFWGIGSCPLRHDHFRIGKIGWI